MHHKVAGVIAVALVLGLGAGGCGGDSPPTKAEFVRAADATCKQAKREASTIVVEVQQTEEGSDAMVAGAKRILARHREMVDDLDEIAAPDALATQADAYLATLRLEDKLAGQIVAAGRPLEEIPPGSPEAELAQRRDDAAHKAVKLAQDIGLKACGA